MAIVSRSLVGVQPDGTGRVWAAFRAKTTAGYRLRVGRRRFANATAAQTALDAYDFLPVARDIERGEVFKWIQQGNDPDAFVLTELTTPGFETYVLRTFATTRIWEDPDFMTNVAQWVRSVGGAAEGPNVSRIVSRLGISTERATTIRNRAIRIQTSIGPDLALDEADVDPGDDI
jgi:hypothetical protein